MSSIRIHDQITPVLRELERRLRDPQAIEKKINRKLAGIVRFGVPTWNARLPQRPKWPGGPVTIATTQTSLVSDSQMRRKVEEVIRSEVKKAILAP